MEARNFHIRILREAGLENMKRLAQKEFELTPRETDVAKLAARGLSYKAIAAELKISPRTVEKNIREILTKSEVPTKSELVFCLANYRFA